MKKIIAMLLSLCMLIGCAALAEGETVLTGSAAGFASDVSVEFTVDADGKITALTVDDSGESYPTAGIERENSVEKLIAEILEAGSADGVDTATGATFTSTAVVEAINKALAANEGGEADGEAAELAFTAGTYEATADGYNGPVTVAVTYTDSAIENIEIVNSVETAARPSPPAPCAAPCWTPPSRPAARTWTASRRPRSPTRRARPSPWTMTWSWSAPAAQAWLPRPRPPRMATPCW